MKQSIVKKQQAVRTIQQVDVIKQQDTAQSQQSYVTMQQGLVKSQQGSAWVIARLGNIKKNGVKQKKIRFSLETDLFIW